jgi:putative ABC transport system substrate-binding protein
MRRREFISLLGGAAAWPAVAQQAPRLRRIGALIGSARDDPVARTRMAEFEERLRELGWLIGRDVEIQHRWSGGETDLTRTFARELIAMQPDVIYAVTNTAMAALHREAATTPIVFVMVSDPVGMGYVEGLARPGRNATGFTPFEPSLGGKWLSLLTEIAPRVEHVGLIFNPEVGNNSSSFVKAVEAAAQSLGVLSIVRPLQETVEIEQIISSLGHVGNGGLIFLPDAFTGANYQAIVSLVARHKVPAIYPFRFFSAAGGLMSYGGDVEQVYRQAASYVDRILRGARPGDLPVQAPTKFRLVINMKTAKALGLTISPGLLAIADEVIE